MHFHEIQKRGFPKMEIIVLYWALQLGTLRKDFFSLSLLSITDMRDSFKKSEKGQQDK